MTYATNLPLLTTTPLGIEVINLKNAEAEALMTKFIKERPEDWQVPHLYRQWVCYAD